MAQSNLTRPRTRGRENLLRERFKLGDIALETGLFDRLVAALGSENEVRLQLGEALHRHACGMHGPISKNDGVLNGFVLRDAVLRGGRHCVVGLQPVGPVWLRISTNLGTGETRVRSAETPPKPAADRRNPSHPRPRKKGHR